jgi:hypothetical protein
MGKAKVGASEGGTWALTLEYFGNVDPTIGEPPITYTNPVTMSVEMVFVACASDSVPTVHGCFKVGKPGLTTPYMDVGNFRVYNEAGFSCPFTVCSTIIQPGPNATLPAIVWKNDWIGGAQDRWVSVADYPIAFDTTVSPMYFSATGSTWLAYDPGSGVDLL